MLKSPAKKSFKAFWRPPAVTVVCLMLLICIVALMVQKDVVTIETAKIALVLCCLIAGSAGALMKPKGEGNKKTWIAASLLPAMLFLIASFTLNKRSPRDFTPFIHAACLMIPGLLTAVRGGGRRKSRHKRRNAQLR